MCHPGDGGGRRPKGAPCTPCRRGRLLGALLFGTLAVATQYPRDECGAFLTFPNRPKCWPSAQGRSSRAWPPTAWRQIARSGSGSTRRALRSQKRFAPAESTAPRTGGTKVKFVYRQSPRYLVPQNLFRFVTDVDPPSDVPGMAAARSIRLDALSASCACHSKPPGPRRAFRRSIGPPCLARLGWTSASSVPHET